MRGRAGRAAPRDRAYEALRLGQPDPERRYEMLLDSSFLGPGSIRIAATAMREANPDARIHAASCRGYRLLQLISGSGH